VQLMTSGNALTLHLTITPALNLQLHLTAQVRSSGLFERCSYPATACSERYGRSWWEF
jgi:hypothetical protein